MAHRILIAGIVRGSHHGRGAHPQQYRTKIRDILRRRLPEAEVYTPIESVRDTHDLAFLRSCDVFFDVVQRAARYDAVVAYVPEASLGTAIQMWEAYRNQHVIVTISPMKENHAVKALSSHVCKDIGEFRKFVSSGQFEALLQKVKPQSKT